MPKKPNDLPEVIDLSPSEVEAMLAELEKTNLSLSTKKIVKRCVELALWLPQAIQAKNISISRLKNLLFGKTKRRSSKSKNKKSKQEPEQADPSHSDAVTAEEDALNEKPDNTSSGNINPTKKGHGRMGRSEYADIAEKIVLNFTDEQMTIGAACPLNCGGKLSYYKPGSLLRVKGQNMARVVDYELVKLRCRLCGELFIAPIPPEVGPEKYDACFKSIIVVQKYFVAVPFYRQEQYQLLLGFRLPDATQWDLVAQVAGCCYEVFNELMKLAANGQLVHNDDTSLKILEHIENCKDNETLRRGMYTTGMLVQSQGHQICLYLNGIKHAGENLTDLLKLRTTKEPIIQMCDGLSHNVSPAFETILCNCLSHGFRKFEEIQEHFTEPCLQVMEYINQIYRIDDDTQTMSAKARLQYHQKHSGPVVQKLKAYMEHLLSAHLVEDNSELGKAIKYMLKRWDKLTRFLTVAGAPLDNNSIEQALKIAILNRKNAMFYKSYHSAKIGGMLTSLINTCRLSKKNAHHYLTVLQEYRQQVIRQPSQWLPWNYELSLSTLVPG